MNFPNLHVVKPSCSSQKVDEPLSVCCINVQSLDNKALSVANFVVTQGIDIIGSIIIFLTYLAKKVRKVVVLQLFIFLGLM